MKGHFRKWALPAMVMLMMAAVSAGEGLQLPQFEKHQLENGMTVLLMEQKELPIVSFDLIVRAGSVLDPKGKEGVATLTAGLLRKGTTKRSADDISSQLDFVGGQLSFSADVDYSGGSAEFLTKDLSTGLELLSDVLRDPTFPEAEFSKLVQQEIGGIRSAKDRPQSVISRYFNGYLFGEHPYSRPVRGDEKSLQAIERSDVVNFYREHYNPGNIILAVVGDFESRMMKEALSKHFGGWPAKSIREAELPAAPPVKGKRLLLVDKPDATQTFFAIGNVGIDRKNPDRVAVDLVNTLLGGRFTSMLNSELRIKSGLTYGARSFFDMTVRPGPFVAFSFTATDSTEKAIDMTLDILKRLHEKGISQEQLDSAKNYIKGQYPPSIETTDQLANLLAELEFYGLDRSEVDELYSQIDALTPADARRVIQEHFPLENLVFTLIGKAEEIGEVAQKYAGTIDRKSIGDPGF